MTNAEKLTTVFGPARTAVVYTSPEAGRLNGNTFPATSLPSAATRRCADHASVRPRFSLPIVPLINPDYAGSASAYMVQHRLDDFEAHIPGGGEILFQK
jgi:hypothetical protein